MYATGMSDRLSIYWYPAYNLSLSLVKCNYFLKHQTKGHATECPLTCTEPQHVILPVLLNFKLQSLIPTKSETGSVPVQKYTETNSHCMLTSLLVKHRLNIQFLFILS